mgnify:CR=1 FL=1
MARSQETFSKKEKEKKAKEQEIVAAEVKKQEKVKEILAQEKDVIRDKDRLIIKTDPIYFDYNMWYIRKESKIVLGRVVELMKKYPGMVIEIGSHTDSRGKDKYNLDLSERRAKSTVQYVISKGISPTRITGNGFGETQPKIDCKNKCTDAEYALNRRSEFLLVKK